MWSGLILNCTNLPKASFIQNLANYAPSINNKTNLSNMHLNANDSSRNIYLVSLQEPINKVNNT